MRVEQDAGAKPVKMWVGGKPELVEACIGRYEDKPDIEPAALAQLKNIARLPFIHKHVAAMPDVHLGIGATVGSVIPTHGAIIPAAVGVDIGCGMNAVRTSLKLSDLPDSLAQIRHSIERGVPSGVGGAHQQSNVSIMSVNHRAMRAAGLFDGVDDPELGASGSMLIMDLFGDGVLTKALTQLGTLGSGNHFIEICGDENQDVWVMLHSGSRGVGNMIGRHFIESAKKEMERYFVRLPDADLAYFPEGTTGFRDYVQAVNWAQNYALENRKVMMAEVLRNMHHHIAVPFEITSEAINCHHNYVELENHFGSNVYVTRKGAIRAREGDLGIIPGSMGQRSYIVRGKGNPESFCSCSHGAGRVMSRTAARRHFTVEDLVAQTVGVECRKDDAVLDEIPGAYKNIDEVMALQSDLVEVVHTLKQVLCVKGA